MEIDPSFCVPRIVQLSLRTPAILPPRLPSGAFAKHRLQFPGLAPAPAHPFRPCRSQRTGERGKNSEVTPFCPARPQPRSLALLGTAHCRAHSRRPITALNQFGPRENLVTRGAAFWPPRSVLISVGKQY